MTRDNANDRCARCDCADATPATGTPDAHALLAELRAQVEALRAERDRARDDARLLGRVLALYAPITRRRLAALLWRSARARRHRDLLAEMRAERDAALRAYRISEDLRVLTQSDLLAAYRIASDHRDALLRGLESMRRDGLDLDDLHTAPVWTGKVMVGGRLVFDLATVAVPEDAPAPEAE